MTYELTIDTSKLVAALERVARAAHRVGWQVELTCLLLDCGTGPGAEARMYVRGGFDHRFTHPADRDAYTQLIARKSPALAAAFLRGWTSHRGVDTRPVNAWYRLIGNTRVEVTAEVAA